MTARMSINGKVYDAVDVMKLTMRDMLIFETQVKALGREITWAEVIQWNDEMAALDTDEQRGKHPEAMWLGAIGVWAARRAAGEDVTFEEAVDVPSSEIKLLPDTADHKKKATAGKARKPRAATAQGGNSAAGTPSVEP